MPPTLAAATITISGLFNEKYLLTLSESVKSKSLLDGVKRFLFLGSSCIYPKYANQQLRTSLVLPNGTGNSVRIAVLTEPDYVDDVLKMGVEVAGSDDLLEEIGNGNLNFDLFQLYNQT